MEEIPKPADVTYMLKPAPATTATSCGGVDESMYVFCIDVSGSMSVSQQVSIYYQHLSGCAAFLADLTAAHSMICYWHVAVICLCTCLSVCDAVHYD